MGGRGLGEALRAVTEERADTVVILEKRSLPPGAGVRSGRLVCGGRTRDRYRSPGPRHLCPGPDAVLPAATFAESSGTLVNHEGRAQRFYRACAPVPDIRESWRWLEAIMHAAGRRQFPGWQTLDQIMAALAEALPVFSPVPQVAPGAEFRDMGARIPRQPHRYSGRTAMLADISVHEPKPPIDADSPSILLHGRLRRSAALRPSSRGFGAPGWNSVQALNKFQSEVGGPLRGG